MDLILGWAWLEYEYKCKLLDHLLFLLHMHFNEYISMIIWTENDKFTIFEYGVFDQEE